MQPGTSSEFATRPGSATVLFARRAHYGGRQLHRLARGRGSVGRASPCQGEGRGFESRRPLGDAEHRRVRSTAVLGIHGEPSTWRFGCRKSFRGGVAEWFRQGPAKPCTRVRFPSPPRIHLAFSAVFSACPGPALGQRPASPCRSSEHCRCRPHRAHVGRTLAPRRGQAAAGRGVRAGRKLVLTLVVSRRGTGRPGPHTDRLPPLVASPGRLAQRESASLTRKRSQVQILYRPPVNTPSLALEDQVPGPTVCRASGAASPAG